MTARLAMHWIACGFVLLLAAQPATAQACDVERPLKVDAVELIDRAKEVEGKVEFERRHGSHTYRFINQTNLQAFIADPARYEIQLGGACARMGPLSGAGSTNLFAVHQGRLYLFASEQCRHTFLAAPEKYLERDDPKPPVDDELLRKGEITLTMIAANAGMLRKRSRPPIATLRQQLRHTVESGGQTHVVMREVAWRFPHGVREDVCTQGSCVSNVVRGESGWSTDSRGTQPLVGSQRQALWRQAGRHPWLFAMLRDDPGLIAVNSGERRIVKFEDEDDQECSQVTVHWQGANTTLAVDGAGRCRVMSYRGRGPDATIGEIEMIFSKFHIKDRELPGHVEVTFNGKRVPELSGDYEQQAVNDPADLGLLESPASPDR